MTKMQKINETDFDFNKTTNSIPITSYIVERVVACAFVIIFGCIFFNSHNTNSSPLKNISSNAVSVKKYSDYIVTAKDNKLFEDIFNYNTSSSINNNKNSYITYITDHVKKDDMENAEFVNKNNNEKIIVTSKILAVDSADKNQIMKEEGFANLDYVDIVVQKTYQQGKEVYFEQQMVNVRMENHQIIGLNIHRMID